MVVLICISLVTSRVEHLMCLLICTSFVTCVCNLLLLLIGFFIFLILRWKLSIIHSYKMNEYKLLFCECFFLFSIQKYTEKKDFKS